MQYARLSVFPLAAALAGCFGNPGAGGSGDGIEDIAAGRVGGSIASAEIGEDEGRRARQAEELLVGRFPGVRVMRTSGGGFSILIRGSRSFTGSAEPLYVVDGTPVQVEPGRGIDWINPLDIAKIQVLKDAASTALYGMRGGNGVVLITTRRGG